MSKLFSSLKNSLLRSKKQPKYKEYTHTELKLIAMRSRMFLQERYKKQCQKIQQQDSKFRKIQQKERGSVQQSQQKEPVFKSDSPYIEQKYELLQQIGLKVIQVESIKIYIQLLRKIQAYAPQIIAHNGDIVHMQLELKWFQCILWYRKCHQIQNILDELYNFCLNFFKGVDITMQLHVKCEIFQIYPILKYLAEGVVMPMELVIEEIKHYVSFQIGHEELNHYYKMNRKDIKEWSKGEKDFAKKERSISPRNHGIVHSPSRKNLNRSKTPPHFQKGNTSSQVQPYSNNFGEQSWSQNQGNSNPYSNNFVHASFGQSSSMPLINPQQTQPQTQPQNQNQNQNQNYMSFGESKNNHPPITNRNDQQDQISKMISNLDTNLQQQQLDNYGIQKKSSESEEPMSKPKTSGSGLRFNNLFASGMMSKIKEQKESEKKQAEQARFDQKTAQGNSQIQAKQISIGELINDEDKQHNEISISANEDADEIQKMLQNIEAQNFKHRQQQFGQAEIEELNLHKTESSDYQEIQPINSCSDGLPNYLTNPEINSPNINKKELSQDELQSLKFIQQSIDSNGNSPSNQQGDQIGQQSQLPIEPHQPDEDNKKKFVKKPYMVSIYARKEYMDTVKKND